MLASDSCRRKRHAFFPSNRHIPEHHHRNISTLACRSSRPPLPRNHSASAPRPSSPTKMTAALLRAPSHTAKAGGVPGRTTRQATLLTRPRSLRAPSCPTSTASAGCCGSSRLERSRSSQAPISRRGTQRSRRSCSSATPSQTTVPPCGRSTSALWPCP